jgi:hypothetical protein
VYWYNVKGGLHIMTLASKTNEITKPSDPIGWERNFGPKEFTLG